MIRHISTRSAVHHTVAILIIAAIAVLIHLLTGGCGSIRALF